MALSRRNMLAIIGGGTILAAAGGIGAVALRSPRSAGLPWTVAGAQAEPRRHALSYALLAPNPHNRQPWLVDLAEPGVVMLYADPKRLLPVTDPMNRQITIGLGGFLEVMRMAASHNGHRVTMTLFPQGENAQALDNRPVARAVFTPDSSVTPDPLLTHILNRRSNKEPFDLKHPVAPAILVSLRGAVTASRFGGSVAQQDIAELRALSHEALRVEVETPHTFKESIDLFRIGRTEVDANPDGIDFTGPLFELMGATGLFTRASAMDPQSQAYKSGLEAVLANTDTAMGHVWLVTPTNTRADQIAAGVDWVRLNLTATKNGLAVQPLSQALQEFSEMAALFAKIHKKLAPEGGTVQMFGRIGYGPVVSPSPRWPLESRIVNA